MGGHTDPRRAARHHSPWDQERPHEHTFAKATGSGRQWGAGWRGHRPIHGLQVSMLNEIEHSTAGGLTLKENIPT